MLFEKVAQAAVELFQDTFPLIKASMAPRTPQDPTQATYFGARTPDDGKIDWERPAIALYNLVRAVTAPYPGAFTYLRGKKLYVWSAHVIQDGVGGRWPPGTILGSHNGGCLIATETGHLLLTQVEQQGEEVIAGDTWFQSGGVAVGMQFGEK